jgi:hypothetical protein
MRRGGEIQRSAGIITCQGILKKVLSTCSAVHFLSPMHLIIKIIALESLRDLVGVCLSLQAACHSMFGRITAVRRIPWILRLYVVNMEACAAVENVCLRRHVDDCHCGCLERKHKRRARFGSAMQKTRRLPLIRFQIGTVEKSRLLCFRMAA